MADPHGYDSGAAPWLTEVLETIDEFGEASVELVAWELSLPEEDLAPAWEHALSANLIEETGSCPETSELMYRLVPESARKPSGRREPRAPAGTPAP